MPNQNQQENERENSFATQALKLWPLALCFGGILITWGVNSSEISTLKAQVTVMQVKIDKQNDQYADLRAGIAELKAGIDYLKDNVTRQ